MSNWHAMRAVARIEMRQYVQHPGRTLLLLLLVAVPVAAIVGGATLLRIVEPTAEEKRASVMGAAALSVSVPEGYDSLRAVLRCLPPGVPTERVFHGTEVVRTPGRKLRARLLAAEPSALVQGGLAHGFVRLLSGRHAGHPGEVVLSPVLVEGLSAGIGDTVTLEYGPARRVTGIAVDPEALDDPVVVRTPSVVEGRGDRRLLVDPPAGQRDAAASALGAAGFSVTRRAAAGDRDATMTALVFLCGSIGFIVAALVIASAFAITLRRRWREIGLLGSVGATPTILAAAMTLSAAILGAVGAASGVLIGLSATALLHPFLDRWTRRWTGGFEVPWDLTLFAAVLGVLSAAIAVLVPIRHAVGLPMRVALAGRRPIAPPSRAWLVGGLATLAAAASLLLVRHHSQGVVAGLSVVSSAALGIFGFGACSPWLLGAGARRARALPMAWRLAVQDAGRFAARNGPVVTAVLAAMSMGIMVATLVASVEARIDSLPASHRDDQLWIDGAAAESVAARLAAEMRAVAVAPLLVAYAHGMPVRVRLSGDSAADAGPDWVAMGDSSLLRALGAESGAANRALASGRLIALGGEGDVSRLRVYAGSSGQDLGWRDALRLDTRQRVRAPRFVVSRSEAEARGLEAGPPPRRALVPWLVRLPAAVSASQLQRAQAVAASQAGTAVDAARLHRAPARAIYRLLLVACLLTGLVVVLVATALTAAESADDEQVLRTIGAPPALMRDHQAARAGYLALLGCALAIPAGLLSAVGLLGSANSPLDPVLPWRDILLTAMGLPVLTYGITWCRARAARAPAGPPPDRLGGRPAALTIPTTAAASAPAPVIRWEPFVGRATDGAPLRGELGRIRVPQRRGAAGSDSIEIAFVRYRSRNPAAGAPLFFIEGGPGGSGVEGCAHVATHPLIRMLEQRDVIGVDQRGTGLSRPNLSEPDFSYRLPLDQPLSRAAEVAAFRAAVARGAAYWRARGVDLASYNSVESADDLDDVRRALGLERIVTYGSSYGSHLSLAYLRRHADRVERAVLTKVEGPDDTWKLPSTIQSHLEAFHRMAVADPAVRARIPDPLSLVRRLLSQLERRPVWVTAPAGERDSVRLVVGAEDLRVTLANALATTRGVAGLPRLLDSLARGRWSALAEVALARRRGNVGSMMAVMMDCASGATPARRERIRAEEADPKHLLGSAIHLPFVPSTCAACGSPDLGDGFRSPFPCDVPVLFVSGRLDARTPPENVDAIRHGFTHHAHVRVSHAGHDPRELLSEEYREMLQAFLRGDEVAPADLSLPFRFDPMYAE